MASIDASTEASTDMKPLSGIRMAMTGVSALVRITANLAECDAVSFLSVAGALAQKLIEHGEAVGENDACVKEAGRRGAGVLATLSALEEAKREFQSSHPSFSAILQTLAELNEVAGKWGSKGYWTKRLGVSFTMLLAVQVVKIVTNDILPGTRTGAQTLE